MPYIDDDADVIDVGVPQPHADTTGDRDLTSYVDELSRPRRARAVRDPDQFRQATIARDILTFLMAERTCFQPGPQQDRPYRATAFWPTKIEGKEYLYPFLRAEYGQKARTCNSEVSFQRGDMVAGEAWETLAPVIKRGLPTLADCNNDRAEWMRRWNDQPIGIPQRITRQMSRRLDDYSSKVRAVACFGVDTEVGVLVFCIDSVLADAFLPEHLGDGFDDLTDIFKAVEGRTCRHRSFWTWVFEEFQMSVLISMGASLLPALGVLVAATVKLLAGWAGKQSAGPLLQSILGVLAWLSNAQWMWASLAAFAVLLLAVVGLLPTTALSGDDVVAKVPRPAQARITSFSHRLQAAWGLLLLSLACLAATKLGSGNLMAGLARLAHLGSSFCVLSAYFCIDRFGREGAGRTNVPLAAKVVFGIAGVLVAADLVITTDAYSTFVGYVAGTFVGTAWALLIGRIDSRYIGAPGNVVAALYLGSALHVCVASAPLGAAAVSSALLVCRLPLDLLFFTVIAWLVRGLALDRYLQHMLAIERAVPRATFRDARSRRRRNEARENAQASTPGAAP